MRAYRQGDVLLVSTTEVLDLNAGSTKRGTGIVAEGEVTGHHHRLVGEFIHYMAVTPNDVVVVGPSGADLVHEEHGTVNLAPGRYEVVHQREYTPERVRQVRD